MQQLFDSDCATRLFSRLHVHWKDTSDYKGVYRPGYSLQESEAISFCLLEASKIGMEAYIDLAGNIYMVMPGANRHRKAIVSGSHLDAVPRGGEYDGIAGVVAPLAVCSAFKNAGIVPPQDICVMAIRAEESPWFSQVSIGSKLAVADLPLEKLLSLKHRDDQRLLVDHMASSGVDARKLRDAGVLFPVQYTAAFIELHIEQGPMLKAADKPVGVVTSIRGNIRVPRVVFRGESGHTGTMPMELRRDAVRAAARFIVLFEDYCEEQRKVGHDLVYTIPVISTGPNASPTTVPDECSIVIEARSESEDVLGTLSEAFPLIAEMIKKTYKVSVEFDTLNYSKPALMTQSVQDALAAAAQVMDIPFMTLPSGAGHDAAVLANAGVPSGMIFIRHDGNSHRADEQMDMSDFSLGSQLLGFAMQAGIGTDVTEMTFVDALLARGAISLAL